MHKKIIVSLALDHGISAEALAMARHLRGEDGEIIAVHVYETPPGMANAYLPEDAVKNAFQTAKTKLEEKVAEAGDVDAVILQGHPGRAIVDYATEIDADCIIMGSHKPGLSDYFLGSTSSRVVRHAPCSVYVMR
ncbi:universal stress protein [uncultured Roseobacter sp.]|uniref:universal stress protein n=1 Tax=uncultured Roseobacter sp. TaxID=114847 RepID=UPI00261A69F3|nr:universal stress protein [uncultured Roseobacter sp.]